MTDGMDRGDCRSCGAPIYWVTTSNGKKMPLDTGAEQKFVMRDGTAHMERVYQSHFVTCPNATQHRKNKSAPKR